MGIGSYIQPGSAIFTIGSGSINSGSIASGAIQSGSFASGLLIDAARILEDDYFLAGELISGVRCCALNQSGALVVAMAGVSGRAPCIGVATSNILSGTAGIIVTQGRCYSPSFINSGWAFSGFPAQPAYLDISGCITSISGVPQSGNYQQIIGTIISYSGLYIHIF